jgi:hypothetical protein
MNSLGLNQGQYEQLLSAFAEVAVLIGAADGKMDDEEKAWSKKITQIRSFAGHDDLKGFYKDLDAQIEGRIAALLERYAHNHEERESVLGERLSNINPILASLPPRIGAHLYQDLTSFARHIAKASGGFLRIFAVNVEEKEFVGLPMINEVIWEEEE